MLIAVIGAALTRGLGVGLLVLAACLLLIVIGFIWWSVQSLTGDASLTLDEALGMAAPSAEEEQKRAVLRALKDLEYERSVGKISEQDYAELSARYRQQARELLRALDENLAGTRERVEALLEERLGRAPKPALEPARTKKKVKSKASAKPAKTRALSAEDQAADDEPPSRPTGPTRRCLECKARNELDARFCKACGKSMVAEGEVVCLACPARYDASLEACPECDVKRTVA